MHEGNTNRVSGDEAKLVETLAITFIYDQSGSQNFINLRLAVFDLDDHASIHNKQGTGASILRR